MNTGPASHVVTDFGAVADGVTNNAWAIQRAIDACAADGGGQVVVPAGAFQSGKIFLRSKVELHLEAGATLLCSPHIEDIHGATATRGLQNGFLCAENAQDISITGAGAVDGNGQSYIKERGEEIHVMNRARPRTIVFMGCSRVNLTGITIRDGAEWTVWLCGCSDVVVDHVHLQNDFKIPNSDGFDIDHCQNVSITNSHIEAGDDAIALKTQRAFANYGASENIRVSHCTLRSTSSAMVIGCEIASPVRHVVFDSCTIVSSHRGLSINHSHESDIEDVVFSNVTIQTQLFDDRWWGAGEPIYVKALPWTERDTVGHIRNVRFENIEARSENGVLVWGERPDRIQDISFTNIELTVDRWTKYPGGKLDLRPCPGAENGYHSGVVDHPTRAVILHNAGNVTLRDFHVALGRGLADADRTPIESDNVPGLALAGFSHRVL